MMGGRVVIAPLPQSRPSPATFARYFVSTDGLSLPVAGTWEGQKGQKMSTLQQSYRGLSLVMELNWDRILFLGAIVVALATGAWLGGL